MIWLMNTNSNCCHIYNYDKDQAALILIKKINHPENRHKSSDSFTSDRPGHYHSSNSARAAYSEHTDPKATAIDAFSREIARELNSGRNANLYKQLILIASPHMMGLLQHHLDKHVQKLVIHTIQKDLSHLSERELLDASGLAKSHKSKS